MKLVVASWVVTGVVAALVLGGAAPVEPPPGHGPLAGLKERERRVRAVVEQVTAATIIDGHGVGSGVVVSKDGYVLSAGHNFLILQDQKTITLVFADGHTVTARRLGYDLTRDVGLLKILDDGEWPHVELGDSAAVKRGDWCVALGHPGGYHPQRPRPAVRVGRVLHANASRLVTDCAIYSGDSGGPLFDLSGKLIGIHSRRGNSVANNRHVPIAAVKADWDRLGRGERWGELNPKKAGPGRPFFGASFDEKVLDRAEVREVAAGSPAADAGLKTGDVVTSADSEAVTSREHLLDLIDDKSPGDRIRLLVRRHGGPIDLVATLGKMDPDDPNPYQDAQMHPWTESDTRTRRVGEYERQSADQLRFYRPAVETTRASTVAVKVGGRVVALGTVIDADGEVLSKASELGGADAATCIFFDRTERAAKVVAIDDEYDLVLLATAGPKTTPVRWAKAAPAVGSTAVTADQSGTPLCVGVVSSPVRSLAGMPSLGIAIDPLPRGSELRVGESPGPVAERAGLKAGDVLVSVGGRKVTHVVSLADAVFRHKPGTKVTVELVRDGKPQSAEVVLGTRPDPPTWFRPAMVKWGAVPNRRLTGFSKVIQHDSPLYPEQCGGPLLNLNGDAIGVNIARFGRVESFAIPSDIAQTAIAKLKLSAKGN